MVRLASSALGDDLGQKRQMERGREKRRAPPKKVKGGHQRWTGPLEDARGSLWSLLDEEALLKGRFRRRR